MVSTIVPSQSDMYIQVTSILGIKKTGNSGEAQVMWEEGSQCIIHLLFMQVIGTAAVVSGHKIKAPQSPQGG